MPKLKVTMKWNVSKNQWDLEREDNGLFINELYNCGSINDFFTGLDKQCIHCYEMTSRMLWIKERGEGCK